MRSSKTCWIRLAIRANIIVTSSSARDTHQIACLIGFGATAVYPTLAYQTILDLTQRNELNGSPHENCAKYRKGINKGLLKIISKMGISSMGTKGFGKFVVNGFNLEPLPPAKITKSKECILIFYGYFFYHFKILLNSLLFKYYETNFFCFFI